MKVIPPLVTPLIALCMVSHVHAQSIGSKVYLYAGQSVTYDGLLFDVSACKYSFNGSTVANCGGGHTNDYLEILASNRGTPTIEIIGDGSGNTGGTAIAKGSAALACNKCSKTSYLDATIQVTRASGKTSTVTAFTNAITGNIGSTGITSAVYYPTSTLLSSQNTSTAAAAASGQIAVVNGLTSSTASMSFQVNLGLTAYSTGVLALNTDRLNFSPAPEPAAITLLIAGLTGLTSVRRRHAPRRVEIADTRAMRIS